MALRLAQHPEPGTRLALFVGDRVRFTLRAAEGRARPPGWRANLRTNLGRAGVLRRELIVSVESRKPPTLSAWRDIPMPWTGDGWTLELPLAEVGYFKAKAYVLDERGWQHWPEGPDFGVNVQPAWCRTANTIYCAFPRMFGPSKTARTTEPSPVADQLPALDKQGFTVIPPSGTLRDLGRELPHIFDTLGCRILHLLPVNPTPTTYARFGRFGSPYACQDWLAIDPALVEFDRRTTGVDQFREVAGGVHARGGKLFLDMVINHTGWGSTLQETHPEWFLRDGRGTFVSPGAWGNIWEDLVELDHRHAALRRELGEMFAEWCRRGVDGFRCDAGYKVPTPVWQYIVARVRLEFPDTVFLLEGLGGAWEATEELLTEGGMQWAYSELFQNYSGKDVASYLDYALAQSRRVGVYVHYSETHDNPRLAAKGRAWSLLRNRLCALVSVSGGFGFTNGVEWLATERVNVHASRGLSWGSEENLVAELGHLNRLLAEHPCFFDGAKLTRLSPPDAPVYALLRESADGRDAVLVLVNTDSAQARTSLLDAQALARAGLDFAAAAFRPVDLLGQPAPDFQMAAAGNTVTFTLAAAACFCLAASARPAGPTGDRYRRRRALEAFALQALSQQLPVECLGQVDLPAMADWVERDAAGFLAAVACLEPNVEPAAVDERLAASTTGYPRVVTWHLPDRRRVTPVPAGHWLLVNHDAPFRAGLRIAGEPHPVHAESTAVNGGHIVAFVPRAEVAEAELALERNGGGSGLSAAIRFLNSVPAGGMASPEAPADGLVLLTNGCGAMARLAVDFGAIRSKYDCLLGANLHPRVPVDRHVFAKRARAWVNADGFLSPLDANNLLAFAAGPPARWRFLANAGDGRGVEIHLTAAMLAGRNTTVLHFERPAAAPAQGKDLPAAADVRLTVRVDIEDRNFHTQTKHNGGAEYHFNSHTKTLSDRPGFAFTPAADRRLHVWATAGAYHPQAEWCDNLPHSVEASRGMEGNGDAYSPGWFELPLAKGAEAWLIVSADATDPTAKEWQAAIENNIGIAEVNHGVAARDEFGLALARAAAAFVVRRDDARTVIAGYPWFLDWGRDTLIAARGLLAAGHVEEVQQIVRAFARFEQDGTLPNSIHGDDASNRDTSDAPLWFGVVCEERAAMLSANPDGATHRGRSSHDPSNAEAAAAFYKTVVDRAGRSVADVLRAIAVGYLRGTPNGIRVDPESGLVWSPSHFTWMDTNHPAGTPREGYPIEIQALWWRLLRQLDRLRQPHLDEPWADLAARVRASFERCFWLEERGWYADVLLAAPGRSAAQATPDSALRSNSLLAVGLGLATGERAQRTVLAARQWLVVPGGLRSLAPLPVSPPLPIRGAHGQLLNDPANPYWGRYEGDEDTRRKPAYHNGTAWTWTLPHFCEALARAWDFSPAAVGAARSYLASVDRLLAEDCLGHLPEILDGDAPHAPRGCDAQAWSVTEAGRVWRALAQADRAAKSPERA